MFLQDGSNDNDGYGGSWWFANQAMLAALQFAGYEVEHAWGDGAHNHKHGSSVLPDALRFLWKGFPASPRATGGAKQPVVEVVDPAGDWQAVGEGFQGVAGLAAAPGGDVYRQRRHRGANRPHRPPGQPPGVRRPQRRGQRAGGGPGRPPVRRAARPGAASSPGTARAARR